MTNHETVALIKFIGVDINLVGSLLIRTYRVDGRLLLTK